MGAAVFILSFLSNFKCIVPTFQHSQFICPKSAHGISELEYCDANVVHLFECDKVLPDRAVDGTRLAS